MSSQFELPDPVFKKILDKVREEKVSHASRKAWFDIHICMNPNAPGKYFVRYKEASMQLEESGETTSYIIFDQHGNIVGKKKQETFNTMMKANAGFAQSLIVIKKIEEL